MSTTLILSCKMVTKRQPFSLGHLLSFFSIVVFFSSNYVPPVQALKLGIQFTGTSNTGSITDQIEWSTNSCSKECLSDFCSVAPLLRYGKYCGMSYSGCPGEKPCDALDRCCMNHDACVESKNNEYLSQECSEKLLNCMENVKKYSGGHTFKGNKCNVTQVIDALSPPIRAALLAGRALHKP